MGYFEKFTVQEKKLDNILSKANLLYTFDTDSYPVTLTIRPNTTPDAQMALYESSTEGVSSQDAKLVFQFFVGEIGVRVYGRLIIADALMGKIKNQAKKMLTLWLQADFAARMEQAGYKATPSYAPEEPGEQDGTVFDGFYEDDEDEEE